MASFFSFASRSTRTNFTCRRQPFNFFKNQRTFSQSRHVRDVAHEQAFKAKKTAALIPTMILLGIAPVVTFALGVWQIQRLQWKVNLIDELGVKLQRPPMELPGYVK